MKKGDEFWDYLMSLSNHRKPARPKPKYFWGDRRELDEAGVTSRVPYNDIPEDQFFNPPNKKEK